MDPRLLAAITARKSNWPLKIKKPAKGMTSSLGTGAIMLPRAISTKMPG